MNVEKFRQASAHIEKLISALPEAEMQCPDAELIQQEYTWAAGMLNHACQRAIWLLGQQEGETEASLAQSLGEEAEKLIAEYYEIWHARNRPGGFRDSVARMENMKSHYQ